MNGRARNELASSERSLRQSIVRTCRELRARDLIGASEGNVSARLGSRRFLLTPAGSNKGDLRPSELVVVDKDGVALKGRKRPSTELGMHLAAYAHRPDIGAVVHAHPLTAVALTVAGLPPPNDLVPEAAVTLGKVAVAPFATPGTDEVASSLAPLWEHHNVVLLERHGALALGRNLEEALGRMETLERVARIALFARLLGSCEPLNPKAVQRVLAAAGLSQRR